MSVKDKKYLEKILIKSPFPSDAEKLYLINNYSELVDLLNYIPKESHLQFLYHNRNNIKKILYDEDEILEIDKETINNNNYIHDYFYLYEIIDDTIEIINYKYDFDLVNKLNERTRTEKEKLKKFILYIFAYQILYNYEQSNESDSYSDENKDKYSKIYDEIDEFMRNQQSIIKEFNLSLDLLIYKSCNIDNIYAEIIISLIKNKKLEDYNNSKNIMEQLDMENIELTNEMFILLKKEFDENSNKEYIECYKIIDKENFFNEKLINFYYILFKYVFKISYYIYQIQFFLNNQKSLKTIIKNDDEILSKISGKLNEREDEVLKKFLDSDYDFIKNKYKPKYKPKKEINSSNQSKEISQNSTLATFIKDTAKNNNDNEISLSLAKELSKENEKSTKKNKKLKKQKKKITQENLENKKPNIEKFEEEREKKEKLNIIENKIKINFKPNDGKQKERIEFDKNKTYYYSFNYFNEHIKDFSEDTNSDEYKIFEYLSEFLDRLKNGYKNNSELIVEMNIKKKDNDLEYNYNFDSHLYKDINYISEETFNYFIDEINSKEYSSNKIKKAKTKKSKKKETTDKNLDETGKNLKINKKIKDHKYKVLYFKKVIGNHNENGGHNAAKFIKEFSHENLKYISGGTDKVLRIYNSGFYEQNCNIVLQMDISDSISQIKKVKIQNGSLSFFVCTKKDLTLYYLDNITDTFKSKFILSTIDDITCNSLIKIQKRENGKNEDDGRLIVAGKGGALLINNINNVIINSGNVDRCRIIKDIEYMGLIQINNNFIALTSNSNLPRGEDKLVIFNIENSSKKKEIVGCSFIISSNGLAVLIPETNNNNNGNNSNDNNNNNNNIWDERYLICACKKYSDKQQNGILFINASNDEFKSNFIDTGDFEVYCFCQIMERPLNATTTINNLDEPTVIDDPVVPTDFFLVGGFDQMRGEGLIKLYKLIDDENIKQKKIKFLQDIEFKKYAAPEKEEEYEKKIESTETTKTKTINMDNTIIPYYINQSQKIFSVENETFEGFNGAISSIIQSTYSMHILVSCYDGKISLLSKINLELYGKELNY